MFNIALFEPCIPQNTGNIIRLAANNGCILHLIEPLGFDLTDKNLKRSGLDYFDLANVHVHPNYELFKKTMVSNRIFALTTKGKSKYFDVKYQMGDVFLFGSETSGLPPYIHEEIADENKLRVPMMPNNRSLNLSNTVALVSYEAWRQFDFIGGN